MEDNKIIIFGSNFGSVTHLTSAKDIKKFSKISICSPNIKKKSQFKKIETYNDYNDALKNNFNFVSIATERPYTISFLLDFIWLILIKNAFERTLSAMS